MKINLFVLMIAVLGLTQCVQSQDTWEVGNTTLTERDVATGIQVPWEILWGPDDHIWVTERRGKVLRIEPESGNIEELLDMTGDIFAGGEPGMLGMALHPNFEETPLVYIAYTYGNFPNAKERVSSFEYNGVELTDEVVIIDDIGAGGIHNGSRLLVLPDNTLLMTTGDRGSSSTSQNTSNLNGKTLRMNLDGSIPADNPIPGSYVYSFGHRNSQGLCLGPTGIIYSSEHGQSNSDEFNIIEPNRNYGWPNVEGACNTSGEISFCEANNVKEPLKEWSPCIAVNGIEYYNHPAIPEWNNTILLSVLGGLGAQYERLSILHLSEDGLSVESEDQYFSEFNQRIRDICVNPHNGAVYVALNGPSYPGSGPNIIKEFRNMDFTSGVEYVKPQEIKIYPNPVEEITNVSFSDSFINQSFEIIAFTGQTVLKEQISSTTEQIDCSDFAAGMYYLKASSPIGTITKTFMVK